MKLPLNPVAPDRARVETLELAPNGGVPDLASHVASLPEGVRGQGWTE